MLPDGGGRRFQCLICRRATFRRRRDAVQHVECIHVTADQGVLCPHCDGIHKNRHALKGHMRNCHMNPRLF